MDINYGNQSTESVKHETTYPVTLPWKLSSFYFNEDVEDRGYTGIVGSIQLIESRLPIEGQIVRLNGMFLWETLGWRKMSWSRHIYFISTFLGKRRIYIFL